MLFDTELLLKTSCFGEKKTVSFNVRSIAPVYFNEDLAFREIITIKSYFTTLVMDLTDSTG